MSERMHPAPEAARTAPESRRGLIAAPGLAVVVAGLYVIGEPAVTASGGLGFPLDDSWIHLQLASRLAAGDGLAYNPGTWVTGSTAPLWSALLAALALLPIGLPVAAKLLGVILHGLSAWASQRLARTLGLGAGTALLAALLTALSGWLLWSAPSAMEVPLATFLSLVGLDRHIRERRRRDGGAPVSMAFFALALLARPEMALLLVLAVADRLIVLERAADGSLRFRPSRQPAWLEGMVLALLVALPTLVFYRAIGGSWLPSTFAVKADVPSAAWPSMRYLRVVADIFFRSQPVLLLATAAGMLRLLGAATKPRGHGLLLGTWLVGLPLAYSLLSPAGGPFAVGNFGRYYFPLLPVVIVLGLYGLEPLTASLPGIVVGRRRLSLGALLGVGLLGIQAGDAWAGRGRYLQSVANVESSDVRAARWLAERLPAEALVATQDIGAVKYFLPNDVLDLAGIVSPEVLAAMREGPPVGWQERLFGVLQRKQPDVIVAFPASYPQLLRAPGFTELVAFEVPGNITMAGNRLAIFSTPWNRFSLAP